MPAEDDAEEVVSYARMVQPYMYLGINFSIEPQPDGLWRLVRVDCDHGGRWRPWDCDFATVEDAQAHARAYVHR